MAVYSESGEYFNSMDPSSGPGKEMPLWANYYLGASTSIQPFEAIRDVLRLPASGIQNVELSIIDPNQWESVPRELFGEMRRLAQMNIRDFTKDGRPSPLSVHAPVRGIEPAGFDQQQGK